MSTSTANLLLNGWLLLSVVWVFRARRRLRRSTLPTMDLREASRDP